MYSPVSCLCKIPLDGVVDHRSFILEVDDSQDPVIPGWDVDRGEKKVILLENVKFRGPPFDIVIRKCTVQCQLGVPVSTCEVTSWQL